MGLFSKILPALEVVGGAALMFVPGGQLAGAMLITSGIASSGLIGGSVGKFLNSDLAHGLMAAVSLGSIAYSMFGTVADNAAAAASATTAQAAQQSAAAADVSANAAANAATTADLTQTGTSFSNTLGVDTKAFVGGGSSELNGVAQETASGSSAVYDPINPQAGQAMAQNEAQVASGAQSTNQASFAGAKSVQPASSLYGGDVPGGGYAPPDAGSSTTGLGAASSSDVADASGGDGFMDKLGRLANTKGGSAAIQGAGSAIGGVGQGILQGQATREQIKALQQPNASFGGPGGRAVLNASAQPITVPQGYLQRAAAMKAMLAGAQGGSLGVQPATPLPAAGGNPVPVLGMNATPRGGVVGG